MPADVETQRLLILGGARSGKSAFAERWVREHAVTDPVTYVATAGPRPGDAEWAERVRRHQQRRPDSWQTRETTDVATVLRESTGTVLVECMALWLTAVLDWAGAWDGDDAGLPAHVHADVNAAIDDLVSAWEASTACIVAVSNEVGWGVVPPTRAGRLFQDLLGMLNQRLAAGSDRVVLCVAGRTMDLDPPAAPDVTGTSADAVESSVDASQASVDPLWTDDTTRLPADQPGVAAPVDSAAGARARDLVDGLAKPLGALGRLEDIGVWLAARQGSERPRPPAAVAVTVFAGDHGIAADASAYPATVTGAMVRTVASGRAGVNALAATHGARVRVRDLGVNADLSDLPAEITQYKITRGTGRIDVKDAMSADQAEAAVAAGRALAREELSAVTPADLLVAGDLGIGNTTIAAALTGAVTGLDAAKVTGRGTGVDDATLQRKTEIVAAAMDRARGVSGPVELLAALGGPDVAAMAGFLAGAAEAGVPVLLDGVVVTAAALVADQLTPGASEWWLAGHRSVEPAHTAALHHLGLDPVVDLGMRLGEGTGALAALPTLHSAVAVCTRMAALADLDLG